MKGMFQKLRKILTHREKVKLVGIAILMVIGSMLELVAVAAFSPFIEVLMQTSTSEDNAFFIQLIKDLFSVEETVDLLAVFSILIAVIYLVKNVYLIFLQNTILSFSYNTRMRLSVKLLVTYMHEPYTFHLSRNVAEMQRCLMTDCTQFMSLLNSSMQLITELVTCLMLGLYLFKTSHSITVVVGGLLIVCVWFFSMVSKKISRKLGQQNEAYHAKLYQWINQSLGGIKEVKILQREEYFVDSYRSNYKKLIRGARINELLSCIPKYATETVAMIGLVSAIIIKLFFGHGVLETFLPQIAVFAVAAFRLLPSVGRVNAYVNSVMYYRASLDMVYEDLTEIEGTSMQIEGDDSDIEKGETGKNKGNAVPGVWEFREAIYVDHVCYHYPRTDTMVLNDVSLSIPKGQTVALIGSSGAGKTTLADIILGLLEPTSGHVCMDDKDVFGNLKQWRYKLGYIPQSIYLSDDTIRNNVAFGIYEDQVNDDAVWAALEKAQLKEFVESLDQGLDTFVGDRGIRISGGQRQRIGIARALYHDPEILVLDEATSALDNETEQAVMESIDSLQGYKTMIIIAHRLTTIRNADKIYEVLDGKVIPRDKEDVIHS